MKNFSIHFIYIFDFYFFFFLMYLFKSLPDVDECLQSEPVCTKEHQECVNNQGSYTCICFEGYEEQDGECVQTQQPGEDECWHEVAQYPF